MKRILLMIFIIMMVPMIMFAADLTGQDIKEDSSLSVKWSIDDKVITSQSGYKIGFTKTQKESITYSEVITEHSGDFTLNTAFGASDKYYGTNSIYAFWQFRTNLKTDLYIYTNGEMTGSNTSGPPTKSSLGWTISWDLGDSESGSKSISDANIESNAEVLHTVAATAEGNLADNCGQIELTIETDQTTIKAGDVYSGYIYLKVLTS